MMHMDRQRSWLVGHLHAPHAACIGWKVVACKCSRLQGTPAYWRIRHSQTFLADRRSPGLQVDDILEPNPVEMMIFVLYLYTTLPQLIPKSSIIFNGKLLETQVR